MCANWKPEAGYIFHCARVTYERPKTKSPTVPLLSSHISEEWRQTARETGLKQKKKDSGDTKDNLWSAILEEVQNQGNTKLPSNKNVLVLGDNETGKTTLIAKLQGVEDPKKGSALEYAYIDVRDEYRDDHTRLSVWVLDGDPGHTNLLKFALSEETFPHTLVILTVAMTTPWAILDQLQSWAAVLGDHIDKLDLTPEQRLQSKKQCVQKWQRYMEPGDELEASATSPMKRSSRNLSDDLENGDDDDSPLPEAVLTTNLGLDIVVVVTKTDYMSTLEKEHDYKDEHFDFIQQWVRRFCLQYGAALFYSSAKEDKNCDLLYKYLTHRIYGLPFRTPALIVEKDAVLIPAGWDSMKKISILYENMQTCKPDDYYRDIIVTPSTKKGGVGRETEVCVEEEQAFLQRQLAALHAGAPAPPADSPLRVRPHAQLDGSKISMAPGTPGNEGVLANFFNSLLYKKTGTGGRPPDGSPAAVARSDAAAELDRLTRAKSRTPQPAPAQPPAQIDLNSSSDC